MPTSAYPDNSAKAVFISMYSNPEVDILFKLVNFISSD